MVIQCVAIVVLSVCVALMAWVLWLCLPELVEITKQRRQPKAPAPKRNDKSPSSLGGSTALRFRSEGATRNGGAVTP